MRQPKNDIADRWARQHGPPFEDRARQSNVFFEGAIIYSYGYHFPMARLLGQGQVLITTRTYSNTTTGHLSRVRRAIAGQHLVAWAVENPAERDKHKHVEAKAGRVQYAFDELVGSTRGGQVVLARASELFTEVREYRRFCQRFELAPAPVFVGGPALRLAILNERLVKWATTTQSDELLVEYHQLLQTLERLRQQLCERAQQPYHPLVLPANWEQRAVAARMAMALTGHPYHPYWRIDDAETFTQGI